MNDTKIRENKRVKCKTLLRFIVLLFIIVFSSNVKNINMKQTTHISTFTLAIPSTLGIFFHVLSGENYYLITGKNKTNLMQIFLDFILGQLNIYICSKRNVLRRQSRDTNRNIKWSVYCQYG